MGTEVAPDRIIIIPRRIPSQNASQYAHWSTYTRERDAWFLLLRVHLPPRRPVQAPVSMAIRSYRVRLLDYANLVGGAKPIPDCLKRLGYLHDDGPTWFQCRYEQFQVPRALERTEIAFLPSFPIGCAADGSVPAADGPAPPPAAAAPEGGQTGG
jgi:hypothetical protein